MNVDWYFIDLMLPLKTANALLIYFLILHFISKFKHSVVSCVTVIKHLTKYMFPMRGNNLHTCTIISSQVVGNK